MDGKLRDDTYRSFSGKSEADVRALLQGKTIHCVECKQDFSGDESFAYSIKNSLAISLRDDLSKLNYGVPALICSGCGYENTLLKILYQI